ncbi:VCBS repeat-containing protein [uncultured Maribacter sp.]|uniref:VCBS repeat-containing protein n=1 Tax=uncultured Maribacter sp. TaxID=431308 RepID=UPI00261C4B4F|nr:VCBS repeat-containing protein [uncultured Maribacter sp.]
MKKKYTLVNLIICCCLLLCINCNKQEKITDKNNSHHKENKLFSLISPKKSNINFNNHIDENFKNFFAVFNYVYNGAGVAIGDINNDGLSDIYFVGNEVPNKLYLNKGDFKFEDISTSGNVSNEKGWHNGVVMADVNGDNLQDIYVCRGGYNDLDKDRENLLYINQGDNTFKEEAKKYGINDKGYSIMASFFDFDKDNDLDLYVTNRPNTFFLGYQQVLQGKQKLDDLFRDKFYENVNGSFVEIGLNAGIKNNFGYGLGIATTDINRDGNTDIYVANDYLERDYLYINQGNKKFKDELKTRFNHIPFYAMGVDVVDFNNDGFEDIMQLEMRPEDYERSKTTMASMNTKLFKDMTSNGFHYQYMHNNLQLNRGNGVFSDIAQFAGVSKTDWSWSCLGSDFDNDGYRDLYITNGFKRDIWDKDANAAFRKFMQSAQARKNSNAQNAQHIINLFKENKIPNYIYKNNGNLSFSKKIKAWGVNHDSFSSGAAVADLDNDGDLDLIVNNINDTAFIYQNNAEKLNNNFIKLKLNGPKNNTTGLGAKITLYHNKKIQFHEFKTVRGYLSSVEPLIHFGLKKNKEIDSLRIVWADGKEQMITKLKTNQLVAISYNEANIPSTSEIKIPTLLSEKTDHFLKTPFIHKEKIYNDFKDQILLPHKLSQDGPCIAVSDINNDGLEDFYIGGASGQAGAFYKQTKNGVFNKLDQKTFLTDKEKEDVGAIFFDADGDNDQDLYVASGGYEFAINDSLLQDRLYLNNGKGIFTKSKKLPKIHESSSTVIPLDFDTDGDLDLFIGGRLIPKNYPFTPNSYILKNENGKFIDVTSIVAPELSKIGMVTSGTWNDIDGDNNRELILVGEWMPISIFKIDNGVFKNITKSYNLQDSNGWWNKIIATDYDKDGDTDFIVGNLGLNYKFRASKTSPFLIYANDFDKNGTNDIFLAKKYKDREVPIRGLQCTSEQMPIIANKFKSYSEFARADIKEIVGDSLKSGSVYHANEFASIILENNNGKLAPKKLPSEAQFSVINGIIVDDFNGDTILDILVAGNKFETEIETTRADASLGSLLLGTKKGIFKPISYLQSGYFAPYNVKDIQKITIGKNKTGIITGINNSTIKFHILN